MKQYFLLIIAFAITTNLYSQFSGGAGTVANPYQITSRADMEELADSVNNGNNWSRGKNFILINDITDSIRTAIGRTVTTTDTGQIFQGDFNGNSKKITLSIEKTSDFIGLFSAIYKAKIYDLTADGYVKGSYAVGGICGYAEKSEILNCINRCNIIGDISSNSIGGICGYAYNMSFEGCINDASINGDMYVGGVCGYMIDGVQIVNCQSNGTINGGTCVGGIVGHAVRVSEIIYCTNSSKITANNYGVGGIVGHFIGNTIAYCINIGTIIGKNKTVKEFPSAYAGGIVGMGGFEKPYDSDIISLIHDCINSGLIIGENSTGGIIGRAYPLDKIHNSLNTGVVIGETSTGGIAGETNNTAIIRNCYYDKQMCIHGGIVGKDATGKAAGHLTKDLIGNNLQAKLGNTDWTFNNANLYPTLKYFEKDSVAFVASSPVYLYDSDVVDFDRQNRVKTDFKVNLENDVKWNRIVGNLDIVNDGGFVKNNGNDTLICSVGSYKKAVPINITLLPIGDVKFTFFATEHRQVSPTATNYNIPIYVKADAKTLQEIVIKKMTVKIDKNVFYLKQVGDNTTWNRKQNEIVIENITIPALNAGKEVVLFNLIGDMLLGTIDSSEIIIDANIEFVEDLATNTDTKNGYITLNICREGSDRFIEVADNSPSLSIKNNPVEDILEVECNVVESGKYVLEVVDITGRSVKVEEFMAGGTGAFQFEIDVANFNAGKYIVVIVTPRGRIWTQNVVKE